MAAVGLRASLTLHDLALPLSLRGTADPAHRSNKGLLMPDHIKIRPATGTWVVRAGGAVLGESTNALELTEGDYPPVIYFPRGDIAMAFLERSNTSSTCPYKGTANYFSIIAKSGAIADAVWTYENPKDAVAEIKDHLAFYTNKVAIEQV
jgi:uncharacterized protein (DUF427 family)